MRVCVCVCFVYLKVKAYSGLTKPERDPKTSTPKP